MGGVMGSVTGGVSHSVFVCDGFISVDIGGV